MMLMYTLFTIHKGLRRGPRDIKKEGQAMNSFLSRVVDSVQSRKAEDVPLNQIISEELIRASEEESRPLTDKSKANDPRKNSIDDIVPQVNDKVQIKDTDMVGIVRKIGPKGLMLIDIMTEHSPFDRNVYGPWELEIEKE